MSQPHTLKSNVRVYLMNSLYQGIERGNSLHQKLWTHLDNREKRGLRLTKKYFDQLSDAAFDKIVTNLTAGLKISGFCSQKESMVQLMSHIEAFFNEGCQKGHQG